MTNENEIKTFYKRNLPHYQPAGCTFFVTFRLANSLPQSVIHKLKSERENQLKLISGINNKKEKYSKYRDYQANYFTKFDSMLDKNKSGPFWLGQESVAEIVKEAIHFRDGKEYDLIAYTIMPNHVHLVFTPLEVGRSEASTNKASGTNNVGRSEASTDKANSTDNGRSPASPYIVTKILQDLKSKTALKANKLLNRSGKFWQNESYDHVIRDNDELNKIVEYILNNPVKAGLTNNSGNWKLSFCKFTAAED